MTYPSRDIKCATDAARMIRHETSGEVAAFIHPISGEVRRLGLMLGVEFVRDRATKEPAPTEPAAVLEACETRGLLVGKGGYHGNVLGIKPRMFLTTDDADFLIDCLDEVFGGIPLG